MQVIENSGHMMVWIIYDQVPKQAWLVPGIPLLHKMALSYANLANWGQFTVILDSYHVLAEYQDKTIMIQGATSLTMKQLVLHWITIGVDLTNNAPWRQNPWS